MKRPVAEIAGTDRQYHGLRAVAYDKKMHALWLTPNLEERWDRVTKEEADEIHRQLAEEVYSVNVPHHPRQPKTGADNTQTQ